MAWFAAHAIIYFKLKHGAQDRLTVWESIYLLEAADIDEAWGKAKARAQEEEGDDDGTLMLDDEPATAVFAGIRLVSEVAHGDEAGRLRGGDELTYSEFQVADEEAVRALVNGEEVSVTYGKLESEAP